MPASEMLFDRTLYRQRRERSARTFSGHDFLHHIAEEMVLERLDTIDRVFANSLIIGAATDRFSSHPRLKHYIYADMASGRLPREAASRIVMDEEWLPFQHDSLDAIFGILTLHHVNDIVGVLVQMQRALKPDGLLVLVTAGARTLTELRSAFATAETEVKGGISPHISPFMEVRDAGALLQRTGFALPVADSEMLDLSYPDMKGLFTELRETGEGNILFERARQFTPASLMERVDAMYQQHYSTGLGRLACSVELLFLTGWKPHASQQQPLARGSGKINLTDVF